MTDIRVYFFRKHQDSTYWCPPKSGGQDVPSELHRQRHSQCRVPAGAAKYVCGIGKGVGVHEFWADTLRVSCDLTDRHHFPEPLPGRGG